MKEGWEYKTFETCLEKVNKTKKIPSSNYLKEGFYPIVSQEESLINGFHNNHNDIFKINHPIVIFGDHTRILKYIDFDFVIGADGVKILSPIPSLLPKFFYYSLKSLRLPSLGYSRHYKLLKEQRIPVPPLEEQKRIVEELDLLSGIIEKQKQQLKELDTLAQYIFYDMFGDPVTNEKGWEVKKLGKVSNNLDSYRKPVTKADRQPGPYPYYGASGIVDYVSNFIFDGIYLLVSEDGANLLARNQPIAFLSYGKVWINNHAHVLDFKDHSSKIYLMFYLNLLDLKDRVKGAAQPKLTQKDLNDINLSWPPLPLQNLFASKIEAIEKQKADITKSIEETQKLFDYTMDKYFG